MHPVTLPAGLAYKLNGRIAIQHGPALNSAEAPCWTDIARMKQTCIYGMSFAFSFHVARGIAELMFIEMLRYYQQEAVIGRWQPIRIIFLATSRSSIGFVNTGSRKCTTPTSTIVGSGKRFRSAAARQYLSQFSELERNEDRRHPLA